MNENSNNLGFVVLICVCVGLLIGFGVGYVAHTPPEPVIEMTVHGLFVNGKRVDLEKLKVKFPDIFAPNKDKDKGKDGNDKDKGKGKRRPGDIGDVKDIEKTASPPAAILFKPGCGCTCDKCPCGDSCACNPCHCADDIATGTMQRGGSPKSPELFGIESLVSILRDFKEAIFGKNGQPGLRDDIANGLKDFYSTLRVGVISGVAVAVVWMMWIGINLQRLADKKAMQS